MRKEVRMEQGWKNLLADEFEKPYFTELTQKVRAEYAAEVVYPPASKIFAAFDACPLSQLRVVIIGQDPYHGPGQANGLAFSVAEGVQLPPSLRNIFQEVAAQTGAAIPADGDLSRWARQGVLLLNSSLSVREHQPKSHSGIGWETFTDAVVKAVSERCEGIVFMLWGSDAIRKGASIDRHRHLVLTSAHPSPLSAYRGFFGNRHFLTANQYLTSRGLKPIDW